jgi:hypothetical protein
MPALVPSPRGEERDLGYSLSAYSPDEGVFQDLCKWLQASDTGQESARRTEMDAPLLVGNDPLIGWMASELIGRDAPIARGTGLPYQWTACAHAMAAAVDSFRRS